MTRARASADGQTQIATARHGQAAGPCIETAWFGHPKGLAYLACTEAWERFSFYGMTALLVLYMVNQLLLPGHIELVSGLAPLRAAIESVTGARSPLALASQIFGLYTGCVYLTPLLGGYVADRWIGQRSAVILGALVMSAGHTLMAFDRSFLLALLLLVTGSGLLKGNISTQVGALYARDDEARRSRGFTIFSTGINIGAVAGPLVCGLLAQTCGWSAGFGAAAVVMLVGLVTYLHGYPHLPARVARPRDQSGALTGNDRRTVRALIAVMVITIFQSVSYFQLTNMLPVWIQAHVALQVGSHAIPVPWYQSIDSLFSILGVPMVFWVWRRQAAQRREPDDLARIGAGAWACSASNLVLVSSIVLAPGRLVHPIWPFLYCAGQGIAFLYYWPTLLALVSRSAPARVNATMMGVTFTTLFFANNLVGWIGGFYERMEPAEFWALHAAIAAAGGIAVKLFGAQLRRALGNRC